MVCTARAVPIRLNAPVGELALATLRATTRAARSGSPSDDRLYAAMTRSLAELERDRDEISGRIARLLDGAWFFGQAASADDVRDLIGEARKVIDRAENLASRP